MKRDLENFIPRAEQLKWFHQIDLGGYITPGVAPIAILKAQADVYFREGIQGKSVLDIGCWDGFNSFEAKKRGASRVLATDHYVWTGGGWGNRECFNLANDALGLNIEAMDIDLPDINEKTVGRFDIVLFCGVFYHLRNPFLGLELAAKVCDDLLVVETHLNALDINKPAMIFYPTNELNNDGSNWWGPNPACVSGMLKDLGFIPEYMAHPIHKGRGIFFGRR